MKHPYTSGVHLDLHVCAGDNAENEAIVVYLHHRITVWGGKNQPVTLV